MAFKGMNLKELLTICENYERLPIEVQGCLLDLVFNGANPKNFDGSQLEQVNKFLRLLHSSHADKFIIQALSLDFEIEGVLENESDT